MCGNWGQLMTLFLPRALRGPQSWCALIDGACLGVALDTTLMMRHKRCLPSPEAVNGRFKLLARHPAGCTNHLQRLSHGGPPRTDFDARPCNQHRVLLGARICHSWSQMVAGGSRVRANTGRAESRKRDASCGASWRCPHGPPCAAPMVFFQKWANSDARMHELCRPEQQSGKPRDLRERNPVELASPPSPSAVILDPPRERAPPGDVVGRTPRGAGDGERGVEVGEAGDAIAEVGAAGGGGVAATGRGGGDVLGCRRGGGTGDVPPAAPRPRLGEALAAPARLGQAATWVWGGRCETGEALSMLGVRNNRDGHRGSDNSDFSNDWRCRLRPNATQGQRASGALETDIHMTHMTIGEAFATPVALCSTNGRAMRTRRACAE